MEFNQILKKYKNIIDKELEKFFNGKIKKTDDEFLKRSYGYLKEFVLRPGKRLRSIAVIMAYKSINDFDETRIYPVCIIPELIHSSSLIHDDIMDEDLLRRNKPTMHKIFESYFKKNFSDIKYNGDLFDSFSKRFSLSMSILQGNVLYLLSNYCILDSKLEDKLKNKSLKLLNNAYRRVNEGQILDLLFSNKNVDEKDYIKMAGAKTGPLVSASIRFGAMLNNAKASQLENLDKYADSVALAFQIHDDIMDISSTMGKGRTIGTDIKRGNKTLLIIKTLEKSNNEQKKFILSVLGNNNASDAEIKKAIGIIKDTKALDYASKYANKKIIGAKKYLRKSNLNKQGNMFFSDLADYVVRRKV